MHQGGLIVRRLRVWWSAVAIIEPTALKLDVFTGSPEPFCTVSERAMEDLVRHDKTFARLARYHHAEGLLGSSTPIVVALSFSVFEEIH